MKKVIGYCRVSTEDQSERGVSLDAQREKIAQYCQLYNLGEPEIVVDAGISAKNLHRPGAQRLLDLVRRREIASVVIAKLDRLTRSVRDLGELIDLFNRCDVALVSVSEHLDTSTAGGRLVMNLLGTVSQWEREVIGERTAVALRYKKGQARRYNAHPLFGYSHADGMLVPVEEEQRTIALVVHLHEQKHSLRAIAGELNGRGIAARSGRWSAEKIRRVLAHSSDRAGMARLVAA